MVSESYRERAAPYIARISRPFLTWTPNRLSALALGLAVAAGLLALVVRFSTPLLFLGVAGLVFASGVFDVVDGEVARRTGRASPRGDFVDHVFDRYADVVLLVGLSFSGFANPVLGLAALASLLLTSYMGTQAQAVGVGRAYSGILSRADRLLLIALFTFLEFDLSLPWPWAPNAPLSRFSIGGFPLTVIDLMLVYFIVASQWTALHRAWKTWSALPPNA